jgi:uncharacterized protein (DUF305 family)
MATGCKTTATERAETIGASAGDKLTFIDELARFDQSQIVLGEAALEKSESSEVRQLAQALVTDHRAHLDSLAQFAKARLAEAEELSQMGPESGMGGAGQTEAPTAYKAAQRKIEDYKKEASEKKLDDIAEFQRLSARGGLDFDRAFVEQAKKSQQRGSKMVEDGMERYKGDVVFATLLAKTNPILEEHLSQALVLESALK